MHSSHNSLRRLAAVTLLACCVTVEAADLDTWELVNTQAKWSTLLDAGYGNGTFVAVGQWFSNSPIRGTILTSPNGKDWTSRESHTQCPLFGVTFGGNTFVAVGGRHTGVEYIDVILASPDATNWTVASENRTNYLLDVCYGNARFVAVGYRGAVRTSDDGWQWTDRASGTTDFLSGVGHGNGLFVAVGQDDSQAGALHTSPDGVHWTRQQLGRMPPLTDVAYGNGAFVAVGEFDTILRSTNGVNWVPCPSGVNGHVNAITFSGGRFIAVGYPGTVLSSTDGITWTSHRSGTESLWAITSGSGVCVSVAYEGMIWRSARPNTSPLAVADVFPIAPSFSSPGDYAAIAADPQCQWLTFSGANSTDADGDALQFEWFWHTDLGPVVSLGQGKQLVRSFPVGNFQLSLRVSDGTAEDTALFRVHVLSAGEAIEIMSAMLRQASIPKQIQSSLATALRVTESAFQRGETEAALDHLAHFTGLAQRRLAPFNPALASSLLAAAHDIQTAFAPD